MIGVNIALPRGSQEDGDAGDKLVRIHEWLSEHVGYGQHIAEPSPVGCDYLFGYYAITHDRRGIRVSFKDARKATMFKLTWGGR